jgi:hypothetical protein
VIGREQSAVIMDIDNVNSYQDDCNEPQLTGDAICEVLLVKLIENLCCMHMCTYPDRLTDGQAMINFASLRKRR